MTAARRAIEPIERDRRDGPIRISRDGAYGSVFTGSVLLKSSEKDDCVTGDSSHELRALVKLVSRPPRGASARCAIVYTVPNVREKQSSVAVNAGSARAFRAPSNPPASFGIESILDELAEKLNMDPVELRIKNDKSRVRAIREKEFRLGAERFGWKEKYKKPGSSPGPIKTGVGCASATWGGGGGGTRAEATVNPDGSFEIRCGTQDLGTGTKTVIALVAAEILGLKPEQIKVRIGDTSFPPSGGSGGSTTCASVSPAIYDTCAKALEQLQQKTGVADARGENWAGACKKLGMDPLVVQGVWQQGLSSQGAAGVQFAEVAVDTDTGFVKVKKITCVQDGGLIVSKLTAESQVNGGIIMGIGYALYEERVMAIRYDDPNQVGADRLANAVAAFHKYGGPCVVVDLGTTINFDVISRHAEYLGGAIAIGIGEPVTIPTAAAIANAVSNAIGVRMTSLPITPQKVLAALGKDVNAVS